jgi:hypothetical protein
MTLSAVVDYDSMSVAGGREDGGGALKALNAGEQKMARDA